MLWPFNKYPGTDYETFNWEWILHTVKSYTQKVDDFIEDITDSWNMFKNIINHEIAEMHRKFAIYVNVTEEALNTGAIADGAVTYAKLNDSIKWYVTPEMFGAAGDGITDDTQAVQTAINSGKTVCMLNTYKISSGIELHSDLSIHGFGKGKIVKDENVTEHFAALYYYGTDIENVTIDSLEIVGLQHWTGSSLSGTDNDFGIRLNNAEKVTVSNCIIKECGGCAISILGEDVAIDNNTIIYTGSFGSGEPNYNFGISYEGESFVITGNKIRGVIQGILSGTVNVNTVISNNDVSTNGQHGLYMEGGHNVVVDSNNIHDCTLAGVKFQKQVDEDDFKNIVISDNNIKNCGIQGILVADLSPNRTGIQDITIVGNNLENNTRGVEISRVSNAVITVNNIDGDSSTTYGVLVTSGKNIEISDNNIDTTQTGYSTAGIGIYEQTSDNGTHDITIRNNNLKNTTGIKFPFDHLIDNLYIDGNICVDSLANYDTVFEYAKPAADAILCNNIMYAGLKLTDSNSVLKRCYNNIGISYKNGITFDNANTARNTILAQNSYLKGGNVHINIDFEVVVQGSATKAFSVPVEDLDMAKNVHYYGKAFSYTTPSSPVIAYSAFYTGSSLDIYVAGGNAGDKYMIEMSL